MNERAAPLPTPELLARLRAAPWRWAKTYALTAPHYYLLRKDDADLVETLKALIRTQGYVKPWKDGRPYRYLDLDGWKYWAFNTLVNREPLPSNPEFSRANREASRQDAGA